MTRPDIVHQSVRTPAGRFARLKQLTTMSGRLKMAGKSGELPFQNGGKLPGRDICIFSYFAAFSQEPSFNFLLLVLHHSGHFRTNYSIYTTESILYTSNPLIRANKKVEKKKSDRRSILKGAAIGIAWTAPVIHSVVIPAHAETTQTQSEMTQTPCAPLVISRSLSCGDAPFSTIYEEIRIIESEGCPQLQITRAASDNGPSNDDIIDLHLIISRLEPSFLAMTYDAGISGFDAEGNCGELFGLPENQTTESTLRGSLGGLYRTNLVVTRTGTPQTQTVTIAATYVQTAPPPV